MLNVVLANIDAGIQEAQVVTADQLGASDYAVYGFFGLFVLTLFSVRYETEQVLGRIGGRAAKAGFIWRIKDVCKEDRVRYSPGSCWRKQRTSDSSDRKHGSCPRGYGPGRNAEAGPSEDRGGDTEDGASRTDARDGLSKTKSGLIGRLTVSFGHGRLWMMICW